MMFYEQLIRYLRRSARELDTLGRTEAREPRQGWQVGWIDPDDISAYQPYWAVRAHLLQR